MKSAYINQAFWLITTLAVSLLVASTPARAAEELTMWSHWPDEVSKRGFVEDRVSEFEASNPQCKVNLQFIQKAEIYTAAKTSVRTGQAPDIFWLEPDQTEYIDGGYLEPLDSYIDLDNLKGWAKESWSHGGKVYGLPLEAYTVELYYNKDKLAELGIQVPEGQQLSQEAFASLVRKGVDAGITPIGNGVGDRPYPGAYFLQEVLMHKLGLTAYRQLLENKLSYKDPRVAEIMTWVKGLVDAGAYSKSFMTTKLGESHYYFHTKPGSLTLAMGSWYTGRSFVPPEKGGQPKDFPLGIMNFPAVEGGVCNNCKTLAVGGSYVMYSQSKHKQCAGALLKSIATVDNGNNWMKAVLLQTGIETDPSKIESVHAAYFQDLKAVNANAKYFIGTPLHYLQGKCKDAWDQVLNKAFAGGLIGVEEAAEKMDAACYKG